MLYFQNMHNTIEVNKIIEVKPKFMCIICGLYNAVIKRPDGIYVLPITALKP